MLASFLQVAARLPQLRLLNECVVVALVFGVFYVSWLPSVLLGSSSSFGGALRGRCTMCCEF